MRFFGGSSKTNSLNPLWGDDLPWENHGHKRTLETFSFSFFPNILSCLLFRAGLFVPLFQKNCSDENGYWYHKKSYGISTKNCLRSVDPSIDR